jgi:hypothetical protein
MTRGSIPNGGKKLSFHHRSEAYPIGTGGYFLEDISDGV